MLGPVFELIESSESQLQRALIQIVHKHANLYPNQSLYQKHGKLLGRLKSQSLVGDLVKELVRTPSIPL